MKLLKAGVLACCGLMATGAAEAREFGKIYVECGLGAMIAPKTAWVAVSTNIIWDLGSTAISSDLSTPENCRGGQAKTAAFIYQTYPSLEKDLAQGTGQHIDTLVSMAGCGEASSAQVRSAVRADFATIVANPVYSQQSRYEQAEGLYKIFTQRVEKDFSQVCTVG